MMVSGDALDGQFVRLARAPFQKGLCKQLWREDKGTSVSLLPVMALLSRGYQDEAATCHLRLICQLAGITTTEFRRARLSFLHTRAVHIEPSVKRGLIRFRAGAYLVPTRVQPSFTFPGRLVAQGVWAGLPPEYRLILLGLAAGAREVRIEDTSYPEDVLEWLWESGAADTDRYDQVLARRVGRFDPLQFNKDFGLLAGAAPAVLAGLAGVLDGRLVTMELLADGVWYHLPGEWWEVPDGEGEGWAGL